MHEYSIVQSLLTLIEDHAKRHGAGKVQKVVVKVGILSGVEPHLLEMAFETFKEGTIAQEAQLHLIVQPIEVHCHTCGATTTFPKASLFFECSQCGGSDLELIAGEELHLMELELADSSRNGNHRGEDRERSN
ncbi:MAG: hydrogenase maturation nickel metallochaperone HypA [Nitratiruptor sp.]|nr:hydrogenase maturation nickel metallochaperone HypA [Nitratiruptor sp.]NPA84347.1 hydrogenase maturation nickel metallochaperone HypA [Campylobacterota bacterium]